MAIKNQFAELGFTQDFDVQGRDSIADLIPNSEPRCGIYMLEFSNGLFYVGQAVNVVRRFTQHRKNFDNILDIEHIYFKPISHEAVTKAILDEHEQKMIRDAQGLQLQIINIDHALTVIGEADLDRIFSPDDQDKWLDDPTHQPPSTTRVEHNALRRGHQKQFEALKLRPDWKQIVATLRTYVRNTIPAYRMTEMKFWALSCLPGTNTYRWPCIARCSINSMETFVIGHDRVDPFKLWGFIIVSESSLAETYPRARAFYRKHPNTSLEDSDYKAAASDQIRIRMRNIDQINSVLSDPVVLRAARTLNLRVMRKGTTIHWKGHCFDLADHIVEEL